MTDHNRQNSLTRLIRTVLAPSLAGRLVEIFHPLAQFQFVVLLLASILAGFSVALIIRLLENTILQIVTTSFAVLLFLIIGLIYWNLRIRREEKNAQRELIKSFVNSQEAVFLANHDGKVIFSNEALRKLIQDVNSDDLLGFVDVSSIAKMVAPTKISNFMRLKENALLGRRIASEIEVKVKNEKRHFWHISVDPINALPGISIWTLKDITAQREHEAERDGEQKFKYDLLDELPVGLFSADQDGNLQYINKTLADWLSLSANGKKSAKSHSLADFVVLNEMYEHEPAINPDESGMHGGLQLQNKQGEKFSSYLIQSQKENKKGEFLYSRSVVLRDPFTPIIDDGTGGALLRRIPWLFSDSPVGIVILDLHGIVMDCNRSFLKILGLHRDGVVGLPISDRISKEDRDSASAALAKVAMKTMPAVPLEVRIPADGEREIIASFYVSGIENSDSDVTGLVLHVRDTTDEKNLEVQFNQAQKMQLIGQLTGGVAHNFNNLLTAMGGFCDLLLSRHGPKDPDYSDIMQIKKNTKRATDLVGDLLAFSRRQTWQPKIFSITDELNSISDTLRRLIGENIELNLLHGKDVGLIRTDRTQFEQVVINLAVNSRDAMPGGGTISITTKLVSVETAVQRGHDVMPAGE